MNNSTIYNHQDYPKYKPIIKNNKWYVKILYDLKKEMYLMINNKLGGTI